MEPGTVINERYEIRSLIGQHGVRSLFLALDRSTNEERVLETERTDHDVDPQAMQEWMDSTRAWVALAQRVSHPNVCRVHAVEPSAWGPIVVTEHVPGISLYKFIRDRKPRGGVTADEFRSIAADLQSGLAAIHAQGVIHGDIKPPKITVAADRAVIHHFWFATPADPAPARDPGGTPSYMSPERRRGGGPSLKDDVYALAMTLWEMFSCRTPSIGKSPRDLPMKQQMMFDLPASGLTTDELRILFRALHSDPDMRPDAHELLFRAGPDARSRALEKAQAKEIEEDARFAEWAGVDPKGR